MASRRGTTTAATVAVERDADGKTVRDLRHAERHEHPSAAAKVAEYFAISPELGERAFTQIELDGETDRAVRLAQAQAMRVQAETARDINREEQTTERYRIVATTVLAVAMIGAGGYAALSGYGAGGASASAVGLVGVGAFSWWRRHSAATVQRDLAKSLGEIARLAKSAAPDHK